MVTTQKENNNNKMVKHLRDRVTTSSRDQTLGAPKILTNQRPDYLKELKNINPYLVMTYTYPDELIEHFSKDNIMLVMNSRFAKGKTFPKKWRVYTNTKVHGKAAVGVNGYIIGSWNFTKNSTYDLHEIATITYTEKTTEDYKKIFNYITSLCTKLIQKGSLVY